MEPDLAFKSSLSEDSYSRTSPELSENFIRALNAEQKVNVLIQTMGQMLDHLHRIESTANRTTLTVATGLLVVPGLISSQIDPVTLLLRVVVSCFLLFVAIISIWLLGRTREHAQWLCRAIVRIQQALGMFCNDVYITRELLKDNEHQHWFQKPVLLPLESQHWGTAGWLETQLPYMVAIIGACLAGVTIMLLA